MQAPIVSIQMLMIATAHLSASTRQLLDKQEELGVLYYPKGPWGWFCNVPALEDGVPICDDIPKDIRDCIAFAQSKQVQWLMLDEQGPVIPELPLYEEPSTETSNTGVSARHLAQAYARHLSTRFGRQFTADLAPTGMILVRDDQPNGFAGEITQAFALSRLTSPLPVIQRSDETATA